MNCILCNSLKESQRLIKETKYSFCVVCKDPLKLGHVLVMPKRHVTQDNYSTLPARELKDLMQLVEEMQHTLNKLNKLEDVIIFKNSGKHSTLDHFHIHLVPCKGAVRKLVSSLEEIPERKIATEKKELNMRDKIKKLI